MTNRKNRLAVAISAFVRMYGRKAQRGVEPNDRKYSRKTESAMKHLRPEELSEMLNAENDQLAPLIKEKKVDPSVVLPKKEGSVLE